MTDAARLLDTIEAAGLELKADPPFLRVSPRSRLTDELRAEIRDHKPELLALLSRPRLHGFTLAELERDAGDDWPAIRNHPEALAQFALSLREARQIEVGIVPRRWSETAECSMGCGTVFAPPWLAGQRLVGCCWCVPRRRGVNLPRPLPSVPLSPQT
jgi:hypothetical protein